MKLVRPTARVYVPLTVWTPAGLGVRAGRYDAVLLGDGRAEVEVKHFLLPSSMRHHEAWQWPMGRKGETARVRLDPGEFEMEATATPPEVQFQPTL